MGPGCGEQLRKGTAYGYEMLLFTGPGHEEADGFILCTKLCDAARAYNRKKCTLVPAAVRHSTSYAQSPSDAASLSFGAGLRLSPAAESLKSSWSAT